MRIALTFLEQLYVIHGKGQSDLNRRFAGMRTGKRKMRLVSAHAQKRVSDEYLRMD
jgi:hypothetical protein